MDGMKTSLIVVSLVLLAGVIVFAFFGSQPGEPTAAGVSEAPQDPSFQARVVRPRVARPLFGILPIRLEDKLRGNVERFDHTEPGAEFVSLGPGHLELRAEGWNLSILADEQGRIAPETRVVYPFAVGGRLVSVRCRPADPAVGRLDIMPREGSAELDGSFRIELTSCENVESGKSIDWPPAPPGGLPVSPLVVRGSFKNLAGAHSWERLSDG